MASTHLLRTPSSTGNDKIATFSAWIKRSSGLGNQQNLFTSFPSSERTQLFFTSSDTLHLQAYSSNSATMNVATNRVFRDTNAWYHIVLAMDSTQATASDRVKFYINGVQETSFAQSSYINQNTTLSFNTSSRPFYIGTYGTSAFFFDGLMSHVHWIDGTAYQASDFGQFNSNGVWTPKTSPSVTYGTNGFFLKFENSSNMDLDSSPNNHTFTTSGSLTQTIDSPSNVYAVLNVLNPQASGYTIANGNLSVTANASDTWRTTYSTIGASSGKWYWEQKITNFTGVDPHYIGIVSEDQMNSSNIDQATTSRGYFYTKTGDKRTNNAQVSYGDSWTTGDIVGVAMDLDNNKLYFSKNGVWQNSGDPTSGATGTGSAFDITSGYVYLASTSTYYSSNTYQMNFGNGYFGTTAVASTGSNGNGSIFEYDVPTGYYALNTKNINTYG